MRAELIEHRTDVANLRPQVFHLANRRFVIGGKCFVGRESSHNNLAVSFIRKYQILHTLI